MQAEQKTAMPNTIIPALDALLTSRGEEVRAWLDAQFAKTSPYVYSSVDLRHSGIKLAPVDTNLFPAGFHTLSPAARKRAVARMRDYFSAYHGAAKSLLIVPENHTRNPHYLDNISVLSSLLEEAGMEVKVGSLVADGEPLALTSLSGKEVVEHPLVRNGDRLQLKNGFTPDLVLLNNDLTAGAPELLHGLVQPVLPPVEKGWYRRRKSAHFTAYGRIAKEFAEHFGFDPWLISTSFARCGLINFAERGGIECVATNVEKVLHAVRRKYEEYGITEQPYVFIKADSGTYGMGIMTAKSGEEIFQMNKKTRNKMDVIKEGARVSEVIIQEGVPTVNRVKDSPAEPMMYLVGGHTVGGAFRVNAERDHEGNLNARGMVFTGMCDEEESAEQMSRVKVSHCNFSVFSLVAELATLSASRED